jgi:mycoredoxin
MTAPVIMYTTTWCGYCNRLKDGMKRAGVEFSEVNIELDEQAAVRVMQVNGGNQTVPTLEFADGSALTNPSLAQVQAKLATLA